MRDEEATIFLSEAERLIRQNQPNEAYEYLYRGWAEELPAMRRPQWHWLAGWALELLSRPSEAIHLLEEGLRLTEGLQKETDPTQHGQLTQMAERIRYFLGNAYSETNQITLAVELRRQGITAIQEGIVTNPELKLLIFKGAANDYLVLGHYQQAIAYYQQAIAAGSDTAESPRQQGLAYWGLGLAYQRMGDVFRAKTSYQQALHILDQAGMLLLVTQVRLLLGQVLVELQDYESAEYQLRRSLEAAQQLGNTRTIALAMGNSASLWLARGEPGQAIRVATEALQLAEQSKDYRSTGQLHLTLAEAYEATHEQNQAEEALRNAIEVAENIADYELLGQARTRYAEFLAEQQRFQDAYEQLSLARSVNA